MLNQAHDLLYTSTQGSNTIAYTYTVYVHYIQVLLVNFTLMWYRMVPYLALYMHNYAYTNYHGKFPVFNESLIGTSDELI